VLVAHADWGVDPRKRWVATARRTGGWSAEDVGMINVVDGHRPPGDPHDDPAVHTVEGWILGQHPTGLDEGLVSADPG
jgi:hypothetical protein